MTLTQQTRSAKKVEGLYLSEISPGEVVLVKTANTRYSIIYLGYGAARISGNSRVCPDSEPVNILGSTWGGSALLAGFIGVGLRLQFQRPGDRRVTTTTPIQALVRRGKAPALAQQGVRVDA